MQYVYAAMLLHSSKKEITEDSMKKVLQSAGAEADEAQIKALVSALKDVNIEEAIEKASQFSAAPVAAAPVSHESKKEEKKEEKDEKVSEEEAAAGLGGLFG